MKMQMSKCRHLSPMMTSGPVFPKRKQPGKRSQLDVHAVPVMLKVRLRDLKFRRGVSESRVLNQLRASFRSALRLRMQPNLSIAFRAAKELLTVWNVRLLTSSHRRGCATSVLMS